MRTPKYESGTLRNYLKENIIASTLELRDALEGCSEASVYRLLREIPHCTSYSHRGRFHTLQETALFDDFGLWSFKDVRFSRHGTLLSTVEVLVRSASAGFFAAELTLLLDVSIKVPVLKLIRENRLAREKVFGLYLYCSPEPERKREQVLTRQLAEIDPNLEKLSVGEPKLAGSQELKAAIILFYSLLDEQQRRLYAGLESFKIGHGGDRWIAELLGLNPGTVSKGRQQLSEHDIHIGRARGSGGGAKSTEKKRQK